MSDIDPEAFDGAETGLFAHLIELRARLIRALAGLLLVFVCLLPFANKLYGWFAQPLLDKLPKGGQLIAVEVASPFFAPVLKPSLETSVKAMSLAVLTALQR